MSQSLPLTRAVRVDGYESPVGATTSPPSFLSVAALCMGSLRASTGSAEGGSQVRRRGWSLVVY